MKRLLGNLQSFCMAVSLIAASAAEASAAPAAGPFRIAVVTGEDGACGTPGANAPAGQAAYVAHLAGRLARPVEVCPVADMAAAARLLADGKIDFAQLDPIAYTPVAAGVRPLLTPRTQDGFGRVETIMVVRAGEPENLAPGQGERVGFAGTAPYELDLLKRALTDHGIAFAQPETAQIYAGPAAAAERLRQGDIDFLVLYSAAWQRLCRPMSAGGKPCADLREVFRGRPRAAQAWAVRRDIDDATRFRLVGIHVALHLENPAAFGWVAQGARELEPTEASALDLSAR
jgi:ABC-type phosphate/phosphonate transport system substrate-binding protein